VARIVMAAGKAFIDCGCVAWLAGGEGTLAGCRHNFSSVNNRRRSVVEASEAFIVQSSGCGIS
jgi:hypothetical protein